MKLNPVAILIITVIFFSSCAKNGDTLPDTIPVDSLQNSQNVSIDSILPRRARIGDTITIFGKNFPENFSVTVNEEVLSLLEKSKTKIKALIPEKTGSGKITLTINDKVYIGPTMEYRYLVEVTTIAGSNVEGNADGPGSMASFKCPWGLSFDQDNNLLVADSYNRLIRTVDVKTGNVTTSVNPGDLSFFSPYNLTFDKRTRSLFVTDFNAHILKVDSNGAMTAFNFDNFIETSTGIITGADGMVYFTDNIQGWLFRMNQDGQNLMRIGYAGITPRNLVYGPDSTLYTSGAGIVKLTPFDNIENLPQLTEFHGWELAITPDGRFYQADHVTNKIQQVNPVTGEVTVIAGTGDAVDIDGDASTAAFNGPMGLISDAEGNLYVSTYNFDTRQGNNIRKITFR